jgi:Protein of unknown function (DUF3592)
MNDAIAAPHASWPKRMLATLLWATMAALFAITGWFFAVKPIVVAVGNWRVAADYQSVTGDVVTQTAKAGDGSSYSWRAVRYEMNGKQYVAERLTVLDEDDLDEPANAAVSKQLEDAQRDGKPVPIWVSPRKPAIAVVSRELPLAALAPRLPMALGFGLIALAGIAGALGALVGLPYYRNLFDAVGIWGFGAAWSGFTLPMFMMVAREPHKEMVALVFVGLFALIGCLLLWAAVSVTLKGTGATFGETTYSSTKPSARTTSDSGAKRKLANAKSGVRRGGLGGRGSDFDKD